MEGLQEEDYYQRKSQYDGRRLKTPDGNDLMTPKRHHSIGRNGTQRSNSKRSILKSAKSSKTLEFISPQGPYSKVSFADVNMNNQKHLRQSDFHNMNTHNPSAGSGRAPNLSSNRGGFVQNENQFKSS